MRESVPDVSVVVPVFNSSNTIEELVRRLHETLRGRGVSHELVLVDDGSRDTSWKVMTGLVGTVAASVTAVRLSRNFGQQNATLCGLSLARGSRVVTIDDDLQHSPEDIPALLEPLAGGAEAVYGVFASFARSSFRRFGSHLHHLLVRMVFDSTGDLRLSGFRAMTAEVARAVSGWKAPHPYINGLILTYAGRVETVEVVHRARSHGDSQYTLQKLVTVVLNILLADFRKPLRLLAGAGIAMAFGALLSALLGWQAAATALFSAVLVIALLILMVLGEYLVRIYDTIGGTPPFVIREIIRPSGKEGE